METIRIFIGYDPREAVAYHTCCQSILEHTSAESVFFHPVRGERRDGSNDFTYERFKVPYYCGFKGPALWLDGDMLVRSDILALWQWGMELGIGAHVVKHNYRTKHPIKYLGAKNSDYPRKNWSSVILWNCGFFPNKVLTPEYVASHDGSHLHRFAWLKDDQIGELPGSWNVLVREQEKRPDDDLRHYTIGTPCFPEYENDDPEWWQTYKRAIAPIS